MPATAAARVVLRAMLRLRQAVLVARDLDAVVAELRAQRLERELAAARADLAAVKADLAALREELVWAFAERRLAVDAAAPEQAPVARVVDLTRGTHATA